MIKIIKNWYNGKQVRADNGEPETLGGIGVLPEYTTEYHWTTKVARVIVGFYLLHWKWVWGTMFSTFGAYIGFLKAFSSC